jgi:competence protein ComEA
VYRRAALAAVLAASLAPAAWRAWAPPPTSPVACAPEGRGVPPRGWLGCAADAGSARPLEDEERLLLGLPLDPNHARAEALAHVPGIGPALARAIVADREARGPYMSVDDVARVKGIGPRKLERARSRLAVAP